MEQPRIRVAQRGAVRRRRCRDPERAAPAAGLCAGACDARTPGARPGRRGRRRSVAAQRVAPAPRLAHRAGRTGRPPAAAEPSRRIGAALPARARAAARGDRMVPAGRRARRARRAGAGARGVRARAAGGAPAPSRRTGAAPDLADALRQRRGHRRRARRVCRRPERARPPSSNAVPKASRPGRCSTAGNGAISSFPTRARTTGTCSSAMRRSSPARSTSRPPSCAGRYPARR